MKKILTFLLCFLYPVLALSESSSAFFTPPPTDYSVIFLGNIFGIVDGVLHGSSQMMGNMFLVFNSAVLGLGGVVVTYTLIVGTMNTSHEGQFLGQKWSSIWIPVRSTIGLALLIPKTSGYCLMQIFIAWVVVQGIGAADKVWNSALDYLNLGGVFVAAQSSLNSTTANNSAVENMAKGESAMLQGQVCMRAIQTILENELAAHLKAKESGSGNCTDAKTSKDSDLAAFCAGVPDFLSTFNAVEANALGKNHVKMPNFTDNSIYAQLNGVCGTITWAQLHMAEETKNLDYISADEVETLNASRPIAVQQMYVDLLSTATSMVNNDLEIKPNTSSNPNTRYSTIAQYQYGIPVMSDTQEACQGASDKCSMWLPAPEGKTQTYIFSGMEFNTALNDYNSIMLPVLNLETQNSNAELSNKQHEFIGDAKSYGWIMAGAYFFDMVTLNGTAAGGTTAVDTGSGLEGSTAFSPSDLLTPMSNSCKGTYGLFCKLTNNDSKNANYVINLITGESVEAGLKPDVSGSSSHKAITSQGSACTYGYITNASLIKLPGQPGLSTPQFKFNLNLVPAESMLDIPHVKFACGSVPFLGCVGRLLGDVIWNTMIKQFLAIFINFITALFEYVIENLLILPLTTMMSILNDGVQLLSTSQTHPIVALAYMGTNFINYCTNLYFQMMALVTIFSMGGEIILLLVLPFLAAWMGIMFTIGFMDAYYVPMLPYMLFTFGSVAWFLAVMEAMVAGPIVGLGICHPEGHDALGKAEAAFMILINVFLRPSLMVIGYIGGITTSYVAVYTVNAGFGHFMTFFMPPGTNNPIWKDMETIAVNSSSSDAEKVGNNAAADYNTANSYKNGENKTTSDPSTWTSGATAASNNYSTAPATATWGPSPYTNYASMYAGFFCLLVYTTIYLTVVEKCFSLIYLLPDQVLRWIGGSPESWGKETAQWSEATKKEVEGGSKETAKAAQKTIENVGNYVGLKNTKGDESGGGVSGKK
ncbi:MAG: type IVB secretion system protein DotA [Legionellales bacterium]|nr:type IVB secretion system protein DotA [Legionellales bacterium]